jgi:tRNA threonylcarbamoyladenosine biosynthesis protein TsaE
MAQNSFTQHCRQEADTTALAQKLASSLSGLFQVDPSAHLNISLEGDLGAGKTTFARHLIQALGYEGRVKSPTYTLCEPYPIQMKASKPGTAAGITAHHFDLYRMRDPLEWQEAGFPEKAEGTLPAFDIEIHLIAGEEESERQIEVKANSERGATILERLHP